MQGRRKAQGECCPCRASPVPVLYHDADWLSGEVQQSNKEDRACIMHRVEGEANVHVPHDI